MNAFNPDHHKAGKWLKFELLDPSVLHLVVIDGKQCRRVQVTDAEEIAAVVRKTQTTADGRLLGIFIRAARTQVPGGAAARRDADGNAILGPDGQPLMDPIKPQWVEMPHCVAPQRAVLGRNGQQNLEWADDGRVHTVLIPLDQCKSVEAIDLTSRRDDIPEHRRATLNPNFQPSK